MSIYRARLRNITNALTFRMSGKQILYVFKSRLNCLELTAGSRRWSGSELYRLLVRWQKMHWVPKVLRRTRGTGDHIWQIADAGDQELRRLARSSRQNTVELASTDGQNCALVRSALTLSLSRSHASALRQDRATLADPTAQRVGRTRRADVTAPAPSGWPVETDVVSDTRRDCPSVSGRVDATGCWVGSSWQVRLVSHLALQL